jgi:3-phenylpropionate/trans-cinnamate dioxygenase ferredoxin subunit
MTWLPAVDASAVAPGRVAVVEAGDRRIAVCNTEDGFFAIDDLCSHDGGSLDQGELRGFEIECPRHGARFDVKTGKALCLPAVRGVRSYPTRLSGGTIEVEVP